MLDGDAMSESRVLEAPCSGTERRGRGRDRRARTACPRSGGRAPAPGAVRGPIRHRDGRAGLFRL